MTMKKLSLLVSLLAFIFIASVSSSYAQTKTDDVKKTTEKTTISTSKAVPADKAPCSKTVPKPHNCTHKKPGHNCPGAKTAPCPKTNATKKDDEKNDQAIIEEKDKNK